MQALAYYLEQALPKGGIACVFYPSEKLAPILREAAKAKNCKIIQIGGTPKAATILQSKITTQVPEADIYLAEPDQLTGNGGLFPAERAETISKHPLTGIVTEKKEASNTTHDYVQLDRVITLQGIYTPEELELISSYA